MTFAKFLRTPFFIEHLRWLFLPIRMLVLLWCLNLLVKFSCQYYFIHYDSNIEKLVLLILSILYHHVQCTHPEAVARRSKACNFIKIETPTQAFSCEFSESFTNTFTNTSGGCFCPSKVQLSLHSVETLYNRGVFRTLSNI